MLGRLLQWLTVFFVPGGLIVLGASILAWRPRLIAPMLLPLLPVLPAAVFLAGLLLAWFFHRSRTTYAVLFVGLSYGALQYPLDPRAVPGDDLLLPLLGILLPVNLAGFLVIQERGVFTPKGRWLLGAVCVQGVAGWTVAHSGSTAVGAALARTLIDPRLTAWTALPQAALFAFVTSVCLVLACLSMTRQAVAHGFLWTLVAVFLALHAGHGRDSLLFFLAAGFILVVSLIQTSYSMAYHDELTGLAGRRAFNETLLRLGSSYVIAVVDIDHFKRLNDTYGHEVGDQVLRMVAAQIGLVSGDGRAFRYGGEEFAVVFPGKSVPDAAPHLEALRAAIHNARFTVRSRWRPRKKPSTRKPARRPGTDLSVTVSIGAAAPPDRHVEPSQVVLAADRALYRAKKAGRNQLIY